MTGLRDDVARVPTVRVAVAATAAFAMVQAAATVSPDGVFGTIAVIWSVALFTAGSGVFVSAFFVAAGRSRDEQVTMAGVVWLTNAAPATVARVLRYTFVAQAVIALLTAAIRPFSAVAFGCLAPMFGFGCLAWYGARHGTFAPVEGADVPVTRSHPGKGRRLTAAPSRPSVSTPVPASKPPPSTRDGGDAGGADRSDPDDFDQLFRRRKRR